MAKYNWAAIRDDYEIHGLSYSQLTDKHGVGRGNISTRAKKEGWNKEEIEQVISDKVNGNIAMANLDKKIEQQYGTRSILIDKEVESRLELEGMYADSLKLNQSLANENLKGLGNGAELQHINLHSQITNRNKDGALGKMPTTQVNIQNNVSNGADDVVEQLLAKHQP
ncbi:MAG: hypothetical protein Q9M19_01205 [Mariprofundaceae bacterium]|nr:hypothetical protein [Mariprofundaceae bacterium]